MDAPSAHWFSLAGGMGLGFVDQCAGKLDVDADRAEFDEQNVRRNNEQFSAGNVAPIGQFNDFHAASAHRHCTARFPQKIRKRVNLTAPTASRIRRASPTFSDTDDWRANFSDRSRPRDARPPALHPPCLAAKD